jgi:two-component system sensor histidine kinase YesM
MNEAELSALKQKLEEKTMNEKETRGFGVWNVNQRIKLFYGNEYGIEIESEKLKGTIVRICIPCDLE